MLPLIDLSSADDQLLARRIDAACRDSGFFIIVGHGIDAALIARMFDRSRAFFALEQTDKDRWHMSRSTIRRGYEGVGWQALDPGTPVDLKESFYLGVERGPDDPLVRAGTPNHGPNQWPDERLLPGFRNAVDEYFGALDALARRLMGLLAIALSLPRTYFDAYLRDPMPILRLLHYPPQPADALRGQIGSGAHTDWGAITLLAQDDVGGLEVRRADDHWVLAQPVADSFVVNLGDLMARWTNDRYRSTVHRVINRHAGRDRYSIAYFFEIDYHAIVSALPGCHGEGNPARYRPITAGEHIVEMYRRTTGPDAIDQSTWRAAVR